MQITHQQDLNGKKMQCKIGKFGEGKYHKTFEKTNQADSRHDMKLCQQLFK